MGRCSVRRVLSAAMAEAPRRSCGWLMLMAALLLCQGCPGKKTQEGSPSVATPAASANNTDPYWVHQANPRSRVAVVFVHGLFGTTTDTWTNPDGSGFFRFLHESPGVGERVDIFAFGFTSTMFSSGSLDIREAANKLEQSLKFNGVWDYGNVVFVAHSMGGLVTLRELIAHREHRGRVPLVVLYATPARGSDLTNVARLLVNNPAVAQMIPADRNALLQQLSDDWGLVPAEEKPAVICAYETASIAGVKIVPWSSAVAFCNGAPTAIGGADHINIVKPDRNTHDSMVVLINALNEYVLGKPETGFLQAPDFRTEGGDWVLDLTDPNGKTPAKLVNSGALGLPYTVSRISDPETLVVTPDPTPRTIPPRFQENLKVFLARGGELKDEYRFTLSTPVMGERVVRVRIGDRNAINAAQAQVAGAVAQQLDAFFSSPGNLQWLQQASETERTEAAVKAAREGVAREVPGLPDSAEWFMTADILSSVGWPGFARKALDHAKRDPAATVNAAAIRKLDSVILKQSVYRPPPEGEAALPEGEKTTLAPGVIDQANAETWSRLSQKMQAVPALKAEGLGLQGDVLSTRGEHVAAMRAYEQAVQIKPTPMLRTKASAAAVRPD